MKYQKGQNLSEYGLAVGLVAIVGIVGLSLLGQQVSDLLGNTITKRKATLISTAFLPNTNTPFLAAFPDITLTSPSGKPYTLPNYPATASQFKELIDSTGSDGTQRLAAFLKALAAIDDPEFISKEEQDILKRLAQQGFRLAEYQNNIESSATRGYKVIDEEKGGLKDLSAIDALRQINLINGLSVENLDKATNQESRKEYFQNNPELRALVFDAANKIQTSGQASAEKTINLISRIRQLEQDIQGAEYSTTSVCDQHGCRTLSTEESRQRSQQRLDDFLKNSKFKFGGFLEQSKTGSTTLCVNSATGTVDPNGKDCV
jgi:hypothetical protein